MDLSIGELSRRTGVKVPTIRYYEGVGLMPPPARTEGKQRRYTPTQLSRLVFIRHARELGFEIGAIRELLAVSEKPDRSCAEVDGIAKRHMATITLRIERLVALKAELHRMLTACGQGRVGDCRVIEALGHHPHCAHDRA